MKKVFGIISIIVAIVIFLFYSLVHLLYFMASGEVGGGWTNLGILLLEIALIAEGYGLLNKHWKMSVYISVFLLGIASVIFFSNI